MSARCRRMVIVVAAVFVAEVVVEAEETTAQVVESMEQDSGMSF